MTEWLYECTDCGPDIACPQHRGGPFSLTGYVPNPYPEPVAIDSAKITLSPPADLGSFVEERIAGEYWDFDATYDAKEGWELTMLGGPNSIVKGRGATLAEAVAELAGNEVNSEG